MNVRILAEAQVDLASGFRFYEAQGWTQRTSSTTW
jgi:hypothetical protein